MKVDLYCHDNFLGVLEVEWGRIERTWPDPLPDQPSDVAVEPIHSSIELVGILESKESPAPTLDTPGVQAFSYEPAGEGLWRVTVSASPDIVWINMQEAA